MTIDGETPKARHPIDRYPVDREAVCFEAFNLSEHDWEYLGRSRIMLNRVADETDPELHHINLDVIVPLPGTVYERDRVDGSTTVDLRACRRCGLKLITLPPDQMAEIEAAGLLAPLDAHRVNETVAVDTGPLLGVDTPIGTSVDVADAITPAEPSE